MAAGQSFVVLKDLGENQCVIVGYNSALQTATDVPEVIFFPASESAAPNKCSNVEVEGAPSFAVILNRTIGAWGCDSGANEKGVSISVSWDSPSTTGKDLLATDLARLGLERSATAEEAVDVISSLNEKYGTDYSGAESPKRSFLICDSSSGWILDIAGKLWAAAKVEEGYRKIPSGLGVGSEFVKSSEGVAAKAQEVGAWDGSGEFNFRKSFSEASDEELSWPGGELVGNNFAVEDMFALLREHSIESVKSSQVSVIGKDRLPCHWFTATNNIRESVFKPFVFTDNVRISPLTVFAEDKDPEVTLLVKYHSARDWAKAGDLLKALEKTCVTEVKEALASGPDPSELEELMKDCVEAEVKFYR